MRLRSAVDRAPAASVGRLCALLGTLAAVAGVIVGRTKILQAVVVSWNHVIDRVGTWVAAEMADLAVELEDGGSYLPAPVRWEPVDAAGLAPGGTTGHGDTPVVIEMLDGGPWTGANLLAWAGAMAGRIDNGEIELSVTMDHMGRGINDWILAQRPSGQ